MRRILLFIALAIVFALPAAALGYMASDDGTLAVRDGYGKVWVGGSDGRGAKGALIGSLGSGQVTLTDPEDTNTDDLKVGGCEFKKAVKENSLVCQGDKIRFRVVGGRFRIRIEGDDIDLSVVGKGAFTLTAADTTIAEDPLIDPGDYKLNDDPWKQLPAKKLSNPLGG